MTSRLSALCTLQARIFFRILTSKSRFWNSLGLRPKRSPSEKDGYKLLLEKAWLNISRKGTEVWQLDAASRHREPARGVSSASIQEAGDRRFSLTACVNRPPLTDGRSRMGRASSETQTANPHRQAVRAHRFFFDLLPNWPMERIRDAPFVYTNLLYIPARNGWVGLNNSHR